MSFNLPMHPDDMPDYESDRLEHELAIRTSTTTEGEDTALTDWLGGRQPVLEPVDALLCQKEK